MEYKKIDDLYNDVILDHTRNPRNHDLLKYPDITAHVVNPFCGDEVDLQIKVETSKVTKIGIQAIGCSINQATASLLSEAVKNHTLEQIQTLSNLIQKTMTSDNTTENDSLGDLKVLTGVRRIPVRVKCVLLSWTALEETLCKLRH